MSWLDSAIQFVSPKWGSLREAWRQNLEEQKSYDAASYSRMNANWRAVNQSAEDTDRMSRDTIRARARDLERNSDMMNSVTGAFKRNVIGGGYTIQVKTDDEKLNQQLTELWKEWCKKKNCDVTETQSFNQILRMAVVRKKIDGGILFVKRYTDGGLVPFKLQMIEVDELDTSRVFTSKPGNIVSGGIEYNHYNKAVGYWIKQYSIDGIIEHEPVYLDAKDVIFYFTKKRPSQVREISDTTQTITRIRDVNEFMVAVSVKERIAACLSVFIKKCMPSGSGGGFGRGTQKNGKSEYDGKTLAPGMIKELNAGDEIQTVVPSGQAADATSYTKLQQRLIGAGQGISYEATSRDMSETNYSSARQGLIEDEQTYLEEIELLTDIMSEIYETFVISCVLAGLVDIKDFWTNKRKYLKHEWIKAPRKWIDPVKEANANKIAMYTGQKTFQQIAAENGKDWKEQMKEMADVLEYGKELGIEMGGVVFGKEYKESQADGKPN
ncbi:phage portal protein [Anaerosporobacter faecicola]|uniref:phage portal protein n=1 Tax=Anaerosporobacter faecicola TaxID=2718714 RepID=UPI00143AF687|nr:phage portal protein [Anaerosporobacter faecicola]